MMCKLLIQVNDLQVTDSLAGYANIPKLGELDRQSHHLLSQIRNDKREIVHPINTLLDTYLLCMKMLLKKINGTGPKPGTIWFSFFLLAFCCLGWDNCPPPSELAWFLWFECLVVDLLGCLLIQYAFQQSKLDMFTRWRLWWKSAVGN